MRPGPKFEITREMAIANIQTVHARLGTTELSRKLYEQHGSFSIRAIERKWKWTVICQLAGVPCGVRGSRKKSWHECLACQSPQQQMSRYRGLASEQYRYCSDCRKRMKRMSRGMI